MFFARTRRLLASRSSLIDWPEGTWPKPAWSDSPMPPKSGRSTELAFDFGALSCMPVAAERVAFFGRLEAELICSPDPQFRFHSGLPVRSDSC